MSADVKRAVVVMRIVVAETRDLNKLVRQFLVRGLDRDLQLRPAFETAFARQHELAAG